MTYVTSPQVLLIVNDTIGDKMASPAIRFWELARVLSQYLPVCLAVPPMVLIGEVPPRPNFEVEIKVCHTVGGLRAAVDQADVIVTLGGVLAEYSFLGKMGKPIVLDLYDPFMLAGLQKFADRSLPERLALNDHYRRMHQYQIKTADFMICASEKQRDYWLGMLAVLGRINPFTNDDDPSLRGLIDVVPFGLPSQPPQHNRTVLKGIYKTIAPQDKVILWGGGVWNWLDAPTMIKAMSIISQYRSDVKLFFMGVQRPNVAIPTMEAVDEAIALSQDFGLYDTLVFFNDWTSYEDRQNYLLESDIGVSLHRDHAEARFAFRTRALDYFWAGLPIVATEGDILSEVVQQSEVGRVVKPGDADGVAEAILDLLNTPNLRETFQHRFKQLAAMYQWEQVAQPLVTYCLHPRLAADRSFFTKTPSWRRFFRLNRDLIGKAWHVSKQRGLRGLIPEIKEYLKWKLRWRRF